MIRRKAEQPLESKCIRGGIGEVELAAVLTKDEMYGKGRMYSKMTIAPGNSIGEHMHSGDNEIFFFLSGTGEYNDNGTIVTVQAGDTVICNDGETHSLKNVGEEPLELIALILYA